MSPKTDTKKTAEKSKGWTDDEKATMKAHAQELKAEARASKDKAEGEKAILAAIAVMPEPDRGMAKRIHAIVKANTPGLIPKTWYGMPAYADKDGKVICFFQAASKFKVRYATFGFQPNAMLDDGNMWASSFALMKLTAAEETRISTLVKKAAS